MNHNGVTETMVVLSSEDQWSALHALLQDSCGDDHRFTITPAGSNQLSSLTLEDRSISLRRAGLNPDMTEEDVGRVVDCCFRSCPDGVGVFVLLLRGGAFTDRERRLLEILQTGFGPEALRFLIVVSVEDGRVVDMLDDDLLDLIKACDGRYCRVSAAAGLRQLMGMVDGVVSQHGTGGYTESMLGAARTRNTEDRALDVLRHKLTQAEEKERSFIQLAERREAARNRELQQLKAKQADERQEEAAERKTHQSRRQSLEEAFSSLSLQLRRAPPADNESRRTSVILLGLSGSGKSSALGVLLRRAGNRYGATGRSLDRVGPTNRCQRSEVSAAGTRLILVDTPELWDEDGAENVELVKDCLALALPGPHVFLLVLQVGRFTQGESDMLAHMQRIFGRESLEHAVVLFVRAECDRRGRQRIDDYMARAHPALRDLIRKCGSRYYELDAAESQNALSYPQVRDLLLGINKLVAAHGGQAFALRRYSPQELQERSKEIEERKEGGLEGISLLREA